MPWVDSSSPIRVSSVSTSAANAEKSHRVAVPTGNVFVQVLESLPRDLTTLFGNIVADKRHRAVELATFEPLGARFFDEWSMRTPDLYDLPGDRRALMAAKYEGKDRNIVNPDDVRLVNAL